MTRLDPASIESPIRRLLSVDEVVRPEPIAYRSERTPGHLLHIVEPGAVRQRAEGRPEAFREVVGHHQREPVEGGFVRARFPEALRPDAARGAPARPDYKYARTWRPPGRRGILDVRVLFALSGFP